jgi:hypothetical protein
MYLHKLFLTVDLCSNGILNISANLFLNDIVSLPDPLDSHQTFLVHLVETRLLAQQSYSQIITHQDINLQQQ